MSSLSRKTPLKRTPMRRPAAAAPAATDREERLRARAEATMAQAVTRKVSMVPASSAAPIQKREYVRSKALREAYRLIPCQHCDRDDGTVCCAHANSQAFGKGAGIKADDNRGASLCAACHVPILDQGSKLSKADRREMFWAAHVRTVKMLVARGLWPPGVPVPDITAPPW